MSASENQNLPSEFDLIERYFAPLATHGGAFGLKDDAAQFGDFVLTKDMVVAGVHFFPDDPPKTIAQKALRVNLSDLAAKGAQPLGYLLGLNLPKNTTEEWLAAFQSGLAADQAEFGLSLLGGDTVYSDGPLSISITALGKASKTGMVRRTGAAVGDLIIVSGTIGDAWLGLKERLGQLNFPTISNRVLDRYHVPQPRAALGLALADVATSSADVSDGLLADLDTIAQASGVHFRLEALKFPLSDAARQWLSHQKVPNPVPLWTGGDDFEIIATVPPQTDIASLAEKGNAAISVIGRVEAGPMGLSVFDHLGQDIKPKNLGYVHQQNPD